MYRSTILLFFSAFFSRMIDLMEMSPVSLNGKECIHYRQIYLRGEAICCREYLEKTMEEEK
jgi:hypothetical protein